MSAESFTPPHIWQLEGLLYDLIRRRRMLVRLRAAVAEKLLQTEDESAKVRRLLELTEAR